MLEKSATITGDYRWDLCRRWGAGDDVVFVMLNPSTADENVDDPTIRRCIGLASGRGYGGLIVVNLFPYRSSSPRRLATWMRNAGIAELRAIALNEGHIANHCAGRDTVLAWGSHGASYERYTAAVTVIARRYSRCVYRLGDRTKDGHPRHPLYLPKTVEWSAA